MSVLENKFLKSLNRISHFVIPETSSDMEHLATIFEALEKQIPQKVEEKREVEDEAFYNIDFLCPACETATIGQPYKPNYCKHCGQALDWSKE